MPDSKDKIHLLIIDDDDDYNFLTTQMIQEFKLDCVVTIKMSAQEALDYLAQQERFPDIIFLDINMHGLNGWDFIDEYESLDYHLEHNDTMIFMTSTSVYEEIQDRARGHAKVVDYIEKPLTFEHLHQIQDISRNKFRGSA